MEVIWLNAIIFWYSDCPCPQIQTIKTRFSNVLGNDTSYNRNRSKTEIKITYTMISIVTIFLSCQSLNTIGAILYLFGIMPMKNHRYICAILLNISASINMLIYCIFNKKFKEIFLKWVTPKCFNECTIKTGQQDETQQFQMTSITSKSIQKGGKVGPRMRWGLKPYRQINNIP